MQNGCSDGEVARKIEETKGLFDGVLAELATGRISGSDVSQILANLMYIRSHRQNGGPTLPQDERGGMAQWSDPPANGQRL